MRLWTTQLQIPLNSCMLTGNGNHKIGKWGSKVVFGRFWTFKFMFFEKRGSNSQVITKHQNPLFKELFA